MQASLFLQLSYRWVIKGRSFSDRPRFLVFLKLFEQTYISRCLKKIQYKIIKKPQKIQKIHKKLTKRHFWVEGENLTNQLECLIVMNTSANKGINKPGRLVVKTF